jgi:hypothetical protein
MSRRDGSRPHRRCVENRTADPRVAIGLPSTARALRMVCNPLHATRFGLGPSPPTRGHCSANPGRFGLGIRPAASRFPRANWGQEKPDFHRTVDSFVPCGARDAHLAGCPRISAKSQVVSCRPCHPLFRQTRRSGGTARSRRRAKAHAAFSRPGGPEL